MRRTLTRRHPQYYSLPIVAIAIAICLNVSLADAETLESLVSSGWIVAYSGTVSDEFNGCDYDRPIPIDGDLIFVCSSYSYHYAYRPSFKVVSNAGLTKYLIDNEVYSGTLYRGSPTYTYVSG